MSLNASVGVGSTWYQALVVAQGLAVGSLNQDVKGKKQSGDSLTGVWTTGSFRSISSEDESGRAPWERRQQGAQPLCHLEFVHCSQEQGW